MTRTGPHRFLLCLLLAWSLVLAPFAHALSMVPAAPTQPEQAMPCHHAEAPAQDDTAQLGDCCCKAGQACHCAVSFALPSLGLATTMEARDEYHCVFAPRIPYNHTIPETPPPRLTL